MEIGLMILIVVVLLLLYYLYVTYILVDPSKSTRYDLNTTNAPITYGSLKNGGSTRYSYSLWIYVNSWSNTNTKTIISRGNDFTLSLDTNTPTLSCKFQPSPTNTLQILNELDKSISITSNFPLQKWTYIVISVDNQIVDIYLDGKLLMSKKIIFMPTVSENDIIIGDTNNRNDIFLTSVAHNGNPMDPQTAWNNYLKGNGLNSEYNLNLKLAVLQDNLEQGKVSLF